MKKLVVLALVATVLVAIGVVYFRSSRSLRDAVRSGNVTFVDWALKSGVDPNIRNSFATPVVGSRREEPILCVAAAKGNVEIVRMLLQNGAAREDAGHEGLTPIGVAARFGHHEVVRLLCDYEVDVSAAPHGKTALDESLLRGDFPTAELLISHGALKPKSNARGGIASTLSRAVQGACNVPALRFLIAHGIDVNTPSHNLSVEQPPPDRKEGTALSYIRHQIGGVQKRCDHLDLQINGPRKAQLQSSLDYENKNLAVLKEAEQVLLEAGAKN